VAEESDEFPDGMCTIADTRTFHSSFEHRWKPPVVEEAPSRATATRPEKIPSETNTQLETQISETTVTLCRHRPRRSGLTAEAGAFRTVCSEGEASEQKFNDIVYVSSPVSGEEDRA